MRNRADFGDIEAAFCLKTEQSRTKAVRGSSEVWQAAGERPRGSLGQACENAGATADMTAEELNDLMMKEFTSMTFDGLTGTGATWTAEGQVNKAPKGMVIQNGVYVGM